MIDQVSANDLNQLTAQTRAVPYAGNTDLLASLDLPNGSKVEQASGGAANTAYTNAFQYDAMGNRTRHENTKGAVSSVARHTPNALNQLTALSTQTGAGAR